MAYYTKYNNKWYNLNLNAVDSTKYPTADTSGRPCSTAAYTGDGIYQDSGFRSGSSTIYTKLAHCITVNRPTGVKNVTLTYVDIDGTSRTSTTSTTAIYHVKPGSAYSWTTTAADYYYVSSNASGSGTCNADLAIIPSASYGYYTITVSGVTNGSTRVGTSSSPTATSVTVQYGSNVYCKVKGNSKYYYSNKTSGGYGDAGVLFTSSPFNSSGYITINNSLSGLPKNPGSSSSPASYNITISASCTAYATRTIKVSKSGTTSSCNFAVKSQHALGETSYTAKTLGTSYTVYESDSFYANCTVTNGSYKLNSSSFSGASASTTYYSTTNSTRNGWKTTTTSSSSTGLIQKYVVGTSGSPKSVGTSNITITFTSTALSYDTGYHSFSTVTSDWCTGNTETTFQPFGNTGVSKLDYFPTTVIKVDGNVDLSGTYSNFAGQILSSLNYSASLKHAGLTRSENRVSINSTVSSTAPSQIVLKVKAGGGGGVYRTTSSIWAVALPE